MTSRTTRNFRALFAGLPQRVQRQAREAYRLFRTNPQHPGLHFKRVHEGPAIFSVRVGLGYRALAVREDNIVIWFWIGSHADYDRLVSQL